MKTANKSQRRAERVVELVKGERHVETRSRARGGSTVARSGSRRLGMGCGVDDERRGSEIRVTVTVRG